MIAKDTISARQLMFSVGCFIQSSTLLTAFFSAITLQDSWIIIITGYIASLPVLAVMIALCKRFPKKDLIEINDIVFGPVLGKVASVIYLLFFLTLGALNARDVGNFITGFFMPETPLAVILVMFMIACIFAVRKGFEVVARFGFLFVCLMFILTSFTGLLSLNIMDITNFQPVLALPPMRYLQATHLVMTIPFGEVIVFMMILPQVKEEKRIPQSLVIGSVIGLITMLLVEVRDITVLGSGAGIVAFPSFETLRMIKIGDILERMELFFAIGLFVLLFYKVCVFLQAVSLCICRITKTQGLQATILPVGFVMIGYSLFVMETPLDNIRIAAIIIPFFWMIFELILPLLTLIVAVLRKKKIQPAPQPQPQEQGEVIAQ